MKYDWIEFLRFAEALQSDPSTPGPPQAALRSATSRAYYAAYHCAVGFASQEGFRCRYTGDDHERIRAHFRQYGTPNKTRTKISRELGRLLDHRRKADYVDDIGRRPESLAYHAIGMAKSIVTCLESLSPQPD